MTNKPFSHLVWLGAGNACEPAGILTTASHVTLIEARESACTLLQQQYPQANIINQLLASEKTTAVFHTYNLAEFSAIQPATGLKVLFPGLSLSQTEQLPTCAINETIARLNLEGNNNLLVVDIADSNLALLQTLLQAQQLHTFSAIQLQASNTPLYQGAASQTDVCEFLQQQGYSLANTTGDDPDLPWLQFSLSPLWAELQHEKAQANTLRIALNEKTNALTEQQKQLQAQSTAAKAEQAGLAQRLSEKETAYNKLNQELAEKVQALAAAQKTLNDAQQQASEQQAQLGRELNEKEQHIKQLSHELNETTNALTELQKQLQAQSAAAKAEQAGLAQRLSEKETAYNKLNQALAEKSQALAAVQKTLNDAQQHAKEQEQHLQLLTKELNAKTDALNQLQQWQTTQEAFEKKIQGMFSTQLQDINKASGNIKNHINSSLVNTAKQLESFIGIQNYLQKGIKPLSFHGWPISPDIGLYLIGLIDENHYDAIIEFGSGTSTVLMAKTVKAKRKKQKKKHAAAIEKAETNTEVISAENIQPPNKTKIVTFDHSIEYHAKTQQALASNGVAKLVDLVHAPLVEFTYKDEGQYLYYSCSEKLQQLAKQLSDKKANILVLVDGPPGATNKHARFPALPHLLNALPGHTFTLVMDDYNRSEEKEIGEKWKEILATSPAKWEQEIIKNEKGLIRIDINF